MVSSFAYYILFLFLLHNGQSLESGTLSPVCPDNDCCPAVTNLVTQIINLMAVVDDINAKLSRQAIDLEYVKTELSLIRSSTTVMTTQLDEQSNDQLTPDSLLKSHNQLFTGKPQFINDTYGDKVLLRDCSDIRLMGYINSGIYRVFLGSDDRRVVADVYCDFSSLKESWLVFQRRVNGFENFERLYSEYERGFGNLDGEFWLGNEKLSLLTMNRKNKLRVELEDFMGEKRYAEYSTFSVRPGADNYRLTVAEYSGDAGDSLIRHSGMKFTTKDADNDVWNDGNCAEKYRGGWWYDSCHVSNLNGLYLTGPHSSHANGMEWFSWHGFNYSMKMTEMKIMVI